MITWAYIAGFLDGDGWITKYKTKSTKNLKNIVCVAGMTQVITCNKEMIEIHRFLKSKGIGSRMFLRRKNWKSKLGMVNIIVKENASLLDFLRKIRPFLLIKKDKANEVIDYLQQKIAISNLVSPPMSHKKFKWTKKQIETLRMMVGENIPNLLIAIHLDRTTHAVAHKIHKMNFGKFRYETR